jgi:hypothetical protein
MESTGLPKSELEAGEAGWFQNSHALSAQSMGRSASRNRLWVGGSSKGLADSNGEFSLIESEDRPSEKGEKTGHPESQRRCQPPLSSRYAADTPYFDGSPRERSASGGTAREITSMM